MGISHAGGPSHFPWPQAWYVPKPFNQKAIGSSHEEDRERELLRQLRQARRGKEQVRPNQSVPARPEHQADGVTDGNGVQGLGFRVSGQAQGGKRRPGDPDVSGHGVRAEDQKGSRNATPRLMASPALHSQSASTAPAPSAASWRASVDIADEWALLQEPREHFIVFPNP